MYWLFFLIRYIVLFRLAINTRLGCTKNIADEKSMRGLGIVSMEGLLVAGMQSLPVPASFEWNPNGLRNNIPAPVR